MSTRCATCGIRFDWQPTIVDGTTYCCLGCSRGGPCNCDYSRLPRDIDKAALVPQSKADNKPLQLVRNH